MRIRTSMFIVSTLALGCARSPDNMSSPILDTPDIPSTRVVDSSRLWLVKGRDSDLSIMRSSPDAARDPRMLELWLKTTNVAAVAHSEPGEALTAAHKELTIQDKGNGLFCVLAFSSSNVTPIGPGEIATLELERDADGPMRVEILTDRPMFAPQEAQQGLIVGDPIEL